MGTLAVVMLITCANVANLEMVRAEARQQELAVRAALGAGRARIARDLLTESVLLGILGGAGGVVIAYAGLRLLLAIGPENLPRLNEIALDARALLFTLALSLLSGVLFGMIPVLRYAGSWTPAALQSAGRTASVSRERHHARNLLVVAQVAMALVLLVSAGLMIRTFQNLRTIDPGFADAKHLETMRISIPDSLVASPQVVTRLQNEIVDKFAAIPGVTSVGFASDMPMEGFEAGWDEILIEGKNYAGETPPLRLYKFAAPGFFHSAGTRIIAGREFSRPETYDRRPVAIVSENLARELWGSPAAAVGKRIRRWTSMPWIEVVGVVQDAYENGVQQKAPAIVYWPAMSIGYWGPGNFDAIRSATFIVRSDRAGTGELSQRASPRRLVGQCECAGGLHANDAGHLQPVIGAHIVHSGDARHCWHNGARTWLYRHLRRDLIRGLTAHARDRYPAGARCRESQNLSDGHPPGASTCPCRDRCRRSHHVAPWPAAYLVLSPAVWRAGKQSSNHCCCLVCGCHCRRGCVLLSGTASCIGGTHEGLALGVVP